LTSPPELLEYLRFFAFLAMQVSIKTLEHREGLPGSFDARKRRPVFSIFRLSQSREFLALRRALD
jgi:hypothetical protein